MLVTLIFSKRAKVSTLLSRLQSLSRFWSLCIWNSPPQFLFPAAWLSYGYSPIFSLFHQSLLLWKHTPNLSDGSKSTFFLPKCNSTIVRDLFFVETQHTLFRKSTFFLPKCNSRIVRDLFSVETRHTLFYQSSFPMLSGLTT